MATTARESTRDQRERPRKIPAEKQEQGRSYYRQCTGQVVRWWMRSPEMLVRFQPDLIPNEMLFVCNTSRNP